MLSSKAQPAAGEEGFLMDPEFALIDRAVLSLNDIEIKEEVKPLQIPGTRGRHTDMDLKQRTHIRFGSDVAVKRGAEMTVRTFQRSNNSPGLTFV